MREAIQTNQAQSQATGQSPGVKVVNTLIVITLIAAVIYAFGFNTNDSLKVAVSFLVAGAALGYVIYTWPQSPPKTAAREVSTGISQLILLDEEGKYVREWTVQGETSLLIGKNSLQGEVDIDLSETEYASLISKQHAVLNFANGQWYIEDIDSRNGTGIKEASQSGKSRLESQKPHIIKAGDIIYIANTRILLK
ncbi:FHA domain-containing protein [Brevibacillus dissolubilis]|uniref:FHA domain-containing protein n=1 Tax=Brevibacillus dissolubilis TaxID=1844116 RepID=UPI00210032FE|nr:FHA domain-containing protein [Brevibacillus dissolubilis]